MSDSAASSGYGRVETTPRSSDHELLSVRFAGFELDELARELRGPNGAAVALEPRPFDLLLELVRNAGEVVAKQELIERVWVDRVVTDGVLARAVMKIRSALGGDSLASIKTVHGVGYRWLLPLEPLEAIAQPSTPASPALEAGQTINGRPHWSLQQALGEGGSKQVWLAKHRKTGELRVFKFALNGLELAALKREVTVSRLLAQAPGGEAAFVRIIDWNLDQRPFFIEAEHLPGGTLAQWCQPAGSARQMLEQRLELVARIADCVATAHAVGVLHKDIKPSNVLIDSDEDGQPRPRLADFGCARVLDEHVLELLRITRMGDAAEGHSFSGTPLYLAPECIAGEPPTTLSDVYALGVLLYQMVIQDFRRLPAPGWERDIDDPLLRSDIASATDGNPRFRIASAASLAKRLRTLEARREAADAQAATSLQAERAILAARSLRRRLLWTTAVAILLACTSGTSVVFHQRAKQAQQHAQAQADDAIAIREFVTYGLLRQTSPYANPAGHPNSLHQALEAALPLIEQRFGDRARIAAELYRWTGDTLLDLGRHQAAADALDQALARYQSIDGPLHTRTLWTRFQRAAVDTVRGDLAAAEHALRDLHGSAEQLWPGSYMSQRFARTLAETLLLDDRAEEALALLREQVLQRSPPPDEVNVVEQVRQQRALVNILAALDQHQEAVAVMAALEQDLLPRLDANHAEHLLLELPRASLLLRDGYSEQEQLRAVHALQRIVARFGPEHRESQFAGSQLMALGIDLSTVEHIGMQPLEDAPWQRSDAWQRRLLREALAE